MRRLWAHILIAFASLFLMGSSFVAIFKNVSTNQEYNNGREIVFRLTDKEDDELQVEEGANKIIAEKMATRLDNRGITAYRIDIAGDDIIKVTFSENNDVARSNLISYLSFNGSLALSNMDDNDNYYQVTGEEFLLEDEKTYLSDINNYPTVVIPVDVNNANFQLLLENTRTQKENDVGEKTETKEKDDDGNAVTETTTYLYLWYDFNEDTDRYSRTVSDSEDYDANIASKIIMKFNIDDLWYPDDKENKLAAVINLDTNSDQSLSFTEVRDGYDNARFYVDLLNSDVLDYDVKQINDNYDIYEDAWTEILVVNGDPNRDVAWSRTLIATLIAIVIIALLLVVFFKLSALSISVTTILSVFGGLSLLIALGAEFSIAAVVGLISVAVASLASGIIYAYKLKEESYKGRSLKKANTEAAKKSLLPTLDINLVVIVVGVFAYLLGGSLMRSFAFVSILGGLISLLANLILLRGMMWLVTNTTSLNNRYSLYGIEEEKIPSIEKEEKQDAYNGPYADKDLTKKKKIISFLSIFFCVAGLTGLILSANLFNGQYYKDRYGEEITEVYFYTTNEDSIIISNNYVRENILDKTYLSSGDVNLGNKVEDIVVYPHTETKDGVEVTTNYVVAKFSISFDEDSSAYFTTEKSIEGTINEIFVAQVSASDSIANVSVKKVSTSAYATPNASGIMLASVIATIVMGIYFMIRYRLSRGITSIIFPLVNLATVGGIFSLISLGNIYFGTSLGLIMPFIVTFTMICEIIYMNKERELLLEDKINDKSLQRREEITVKTSSSVLPTIGILTILTAYLLVDFFGFGPARNSLIFVICLIGVLIALCLSIVCYGYVSHLFYKRFSKLDSPIKPRKKKKKTGNIKPSRSSGEPEEAIFIGIND